MYELVMTSPEPAAPPDLLVRDDGVALWRQIARIIESEIAAGNPPPGGRLPTEAQFSQRFGVNRHTVRHALEELERAGLVRMEQGRGTFVSEDVLDYTVGARTRFSEWIRRNNKEPSGKVLQLRLIAASEVVATALGIRTGARVILFERLGLADNVPVGIGRHYFAAGRLRGLMAALQQTGGITAALLQIGVTDYLRQVTRVTARLPDAQEAELLRMPRNRPVLVTEAVNVDREGTVIEYGVSRYPTPRVQIVFEPRA